MVEVIEHGKNGYCVGGDTGDWCQQIETLIQSPQLLSEVGKRASTFARQHFCLRSMALNTVHVYSEAVRSRLKLREDR